MPHGENHKIENLGWLRAAVLGANDGIISTASLMMGMAAAEVSIHVILLTGVAGLVAGSLSMAAGEYVSVHSQADIEAADIVKETHELALQPEAELRELTDIYIARGLQPELAHEVAVQLTAHDALAAHARDELGIIDFLQARPLQAAFTSAISFSVGALIPLMILLVVPQVNIIAAIAVGSLVSLCLLGVLAAKVGGANQFKGALRVCSWGAIAMCLTSLVGYFFGVNFQ